MAVSPRWGIFLIATATLCWSLGGILVRLIQAEGSISGWTIVFWRAFFMAATIALGLGVRHGRRGAVAAVRRMGGAGILSGALLAASFIFYILSLSLTTVANTLVLMSASPLVAAVLARFFLKEALRPVTLGAIAVALAGITVMVANDLGQGSGPGNLAALTVAFAFGANIVVMRARPQIDMVPATLVGGVFAMLCTLPLASPLAVPPLGLLYLAVMGMVQLALGLFLFIVGARALPAAEVGLLTLLEMVFAPLWVWIGIGETPGLATLAGGGLILFALISNSVATLRQDPLRM